MGPGPGSDSSRIQNKRPETAEARAKDTEIQIIMTSEEGRIDWMTASLNTASHRNVELNGPRICTVGLCWLKARVYMNKTWLVQVFMINAGSKVHTFFGELL